MQNHMVRPTRLQIDPSSIVFHMPWFDMDLLEPEVCFLIEKFLHQTKFCLGVYSLNCGKWTKFRFKVFPFPPGNIHPWKITTDLGSEHFFKIHRFFEHNEFYWNEKKKFKKDLNKKIIKSLKVLPPESRIRSFFNKSTDLIWNGPPPPPWY